MMTTKKSSKKNDEEVLMLLREIEANAQVTQRELSLRMGQSLGKINYLLKVFVEKGFIKINNFINSKNKAAYLYCLTPRGIEEKTKITYQFLKLKKKEYEVLEAEIRQLKKQKKRPDIFSRSGEK